MTEEEVKKVNIDKAKNNTMLPIIIMIISISTYIIPLIFGEFDFGIIFEIVSLVLLIIAMFFMSVYNGNMAKKFVIGAILSIVFLIIHDLFLLISTIFTGLDILFLGYDFYFCEFLSISYVTILFKVNKNLSKAGNPIKYKETTDWFYEEIKNNNDE